VAEHIRVAVIGAGFGGLGAAIRLKRDGVHDVVVLERADDLGGTWRDNSYPGCACDVPSHLYSYSFALNPNWSRSYSPQEEIWAYLRGVADRFGIEPRYGVDVTAAAWNDAGRRWDITTSKGPLTADVLVSATGPLCEPAVPKLAGLESFAGTVFHSARWRHDHDLTGRRVAVVGTGASAAQFVPAIQPVVEQLDLYQRTPPWVLPRGDHPLGERANTLYRTVPGLQRATRTGIYAMRETFYYNFRVAKRGRFAEKVARRFLERQVRDPELRARLTPDYALGCKRVILSDDYLRSLGRPNVAVVTDGIREVRPDSVVAADGTVRAVDTIILGTGFHVTDMPIAEKIVGRDGLSLAEVWQGSPRAHLGTTVSGFPNLFLILGPNTGLGHNSVVIMIEAQLGYLSKALAHMWRTGASAIEPLPAAQQAWLDEVDRKMAGTVWTAGGCDSWYLDPTGRNSTLWPGTTLGFRRRLSRFRPSEYEALV
jgi:cation diffusion facilitator CzcD-associated flavoprotein CzcO